LRPGLFACRDAWHTDQITCLTVARPDEKPRMSLSFHRRRRTFSGRRSWS
jgi:hypothetical protein